MLDTFYNPDIVVGILNMKCEVSQRTIDWITNPMWNPEYKGKTDSERRKMIEADIERMIHHYIDEVESRRDE